MLLVLPVMGQGRESPLSDTLYSVQGLKETPVVLPALKLPRYQPNACLFPCLTELVKADKGCSETVGYYFSTGKQQGKELISMSPVLLSRVRQGGGIDGYFIYGNRIFLCYGKNDAYLSKSATTDLLTLKPYLSKAPTVDDFFLGGDTDGVLSGFYCDNQVVYTLIKPCNPQRKREKNNK